MAEPTILFHIHDPMCSWCWAYRPAWAAVQAGLSGDIEVVNLVGGLAPDSDEPMPEATREMVQGHWRRIQAMLGTPFNFDFWTECTPRRDTFKACRAVIVAAASGREEDMIEAIQVAYYQRAMNPSEPETLVQLAAEIGMNAEVFSRALLSEDTDSEFRRQRRLAREMGVNSYPSLVLSRAGRLRAISVDYQDHQRTLSAIAGE